MSLTLSNAARSAAADALAALLDAGSGAGKIRIYSGTRPAGPGTAITSQTLLAEFACADPAFGAAVNGVSTLDATPVLATTGVAAGTATWARVLDSNNVAIIDGKVTASGGGGDIIISTTTVSVGLPLTVSAGTLTMPAGTAD
jgi:hypothetical protein